MKQDIIFVCEDEESGEIYAGYKPEIENELSYYEASGDELPFKTIASLKLLNNSIDFPSNMIEWFDKKNPPTQRQIDQAVLAITKRLIKF